MSTWQLICRRYFVGDPNCYARRDWRLISFLRPWCADRLSRMTWIGAPSGRPGSA